MVIYKQALGKEFDQLHPKLQQRYALPPGTEFRAIGVMKKIMGGPKWVSPFFAWTVKRKFLFPETGHNIPFTIVNQSFVDDQGNHKVYWERAFEFKKNKRYFNALMSLEPEGRRILDYLGEPPLFYSDLFCAVDEHGGIRMTSGKQRLIIGNWSIPLPRLFQGIVEVVERYDDEHEQFTIFVMIRNPLIGRLFHYEGEFKEDEQ